MTRRPPLISRLNPLAPLAVLIVVSVAVFFVLDPVTALVLYLLALVGASFAGHLSIRRLLLAHLAFGSLAAGVLLVNALTRPGRTVLHAGPFRISDSGLQVGTALALRVLLIGMLSTTFALRVDPVRLITALIQHARLSPRFGFAILAGHRMLAGLPAQWQALRCAQQVRAPLDRRGRRQSGLRSWSRSAFGLLVIAIRRGERIAGSLEARGLGSGSRTIWHPVPITRADVVFVICSLAVAAAVILA